MHSESTPSLTRDAVSGRRRWASKFDLFRPGEMEPLLQKAGFGKVQVYSSYQRETVLSDKTETLVYECRL